jgi:NitT/TauT family transport system substrate-binding protein
MRPNGADRRSLSNRAADGWLRLFVAAAAVVFVAACSPAPSASSTPSAVGPATTAPATVSSAAAKPAAASPAAGASPATSANPAPAASPVGASASPIGAAASPVGASASPPAAPAGATAAAPSAAAPNTAPAPPTGTPDHVKYATTTGSSTSAGVFIAQARGYFAAAGIDLEIVPFGGGADMISTIAASQVDVANTDAGAGLINAIARNLPIRFVADGSRCIPGKCNSALVVRKDLIDSGTFKDLPDLKGLSVNTYTPGSTLNGFTLQALEKAGLKQSDVKEQNLAFADVLPAFTTRAIDANFLIEPFTTLAVTQGIAVKWKDTSEILGPQQSTVMAFSPSFATQHQDAGKRFIVAYLRGVRDFTDAFDQGKDQDQIISILTDSTTLKNPAQWKNVPQWFDPNGGILLDPLKTNQQWYVDHGFIPTPINLDTVWDPTYVDYAVGVLGKR